MQSSRPLYLIVVLVLIINVVLLLKIGDLNHRLANFDQNYNNLQSSIHLISTNVNQTLTQFTREQSWITPVQINEEKTKFEQGKGTAALNWQIKDFPEGAEVVFHYHQSESREFIDVPAQSTGAGFFEVSIPLDLKVEPPWHVDMTRTGDSQQMAVQAPMMPNPGQAFEYYVSMKTKDIIKSSEVANLDPAYLSRTKYEPIRGHVDIRDNKVNITIIEHFPGSNSFESVILKIYDANHMVTEKPLEVQQTENSLKRYALLYDAGSQNISNLILQVKYTNGESFARDIY